MGERETEVQINTVRQGKASAFQVTMMARQADTQGPTNKRILRWKKTRKMKKKEVKAVNIKNR